MYSIENSIAVENVGPYQRPSHQGVQLHSRLHDIKHEGNGFNPLAFLVRLQLTVWAGESVQRVA